MNSKHIPHGSAKQLIRQGRRVRGGALDFWGFLSKVGDVIQSGIDTIAPLTAKLAGPVASAVTGLPLTGVVSAVQNMANSGASNSSTTGNNGIPADVLPLLQQIMNKGVSTTKSGKGVKKLSTKRNKGKGINVL